MIPKKDNIFIEEHDISTVQIKTRKTHKELIEVLLQTLSLVRTDEARRDILIEIEKLFITIRNLNKINNKHKTEDEWEMFVSTELSNFMADGLIYKHEMMYCPINQYPVYYIIVPLYSNELEIHLPYTEAECNKIWDNPKYPSRILKKD